MPTTAQQIIEAGIARHTANDPGKLTQPTAELLPYLNRCFQLLYALWALSDPDAASASATVSLAGDPPSGALPADLIDLRYVENADGEEVNVIPAEERRRAWHLPPRVFRRGASLVSVGDDGDPADGDDLTCEVLDAPATLAALATALDARFPVRFHGLLEKCVALYHAIKDEGRDQNHFRQVEREYDRELRMFAAATGVSLSALTAVHPRAAQDRSALGPASGAPAGGG